MQLSSTKESASFFTLSSEGLFTDFDHLFLELTGTTAGVLLGNTAEAFLDWPLGGFAALLDGLRTQQLSPTQSLVVRPIGNAPVSIDCQISVDSSAFTFSLAAHTDSSRPSDTESPLIQEWSILNKVMSHDLREPLRKILIYIDMIRGNAENVLTSDSLMLLQLTNDLCYQAMQLLNDISVYISFANSSNFSIKSVSLRNLILKVWNRICDDHGVSVESLEVKELPVLYGNAELLQSLCYQVLENSVKFRQPGRPLQILVWATVSPDTAYYTIHFQDNGQGFESQYEKDVFILFNQLNRRSPGNGAGLAISKKIAEIHGGSILSSSAPDSGTTIQLLLPKAVS